MYSSKSAHVDKGKYMVKYVGYGIVCVRIYIRIYIYMKTIGMDQSGRVCVVWMFSVYVQCMKMIGMDFIGVIVFVWVLLVVKVEQTCMRGNAAVWGCGASSTGAECHT